jgi:hypothetical protein
MLATIWITVAGVRYGDPKFLNYRLRFLSVSSRACRRDDRSRTLNSNGDQTKSTSDGNLTAMSVVGVRLRQSDIFAWQGSGNPTFLNYRLR